MHRAALVLLSLLLFTTGPRADEPEPEKRDLLRDLQTQGINTGKSPALHWGTDPEKYSNWGSHTSRLIPVYTYGTLNAGEGIDLRNYTGTRSPYRDPGNLRQIYGRVPSHTLNPQADYLDQTNLAQIQFAALKGKKKHIFLVVFDGLDWQTTRAAAIYNSGKVPYDEGRGSGLHFLDYTANATSQYGYHVPSPYMANLKYDVNEQRVTPGLDGSFGGYDVAKAGPNPWTAGDDPLYLMGKSARGPAEHPYPDSASTATSMTTGVKTYNAAINVDWTGQQLVTIAHQAQKQGWSIGSVTSVPISHATPAAAYAHNVTRNDYQDLTRDMLGLPSVSHPQNPLPGMDVVIGGGYGANKTSDGSQGSNFVPGNRYLTEDDLKKVRSEFGGKYIVVTREKGKDGTETLQAAADRARENGQRLLGYFGLGNYDGHLPFRTADGSYNPTLNYDRSKETYTPADLTENPTLAEMTSAALTVLSSNPRGFWLIVEAGDVDWANHDNNIDNSIGAVLSGDEAVKTITDWVEQNSNWEESLMIITGDHGHYLMIDQPELLIDPNRPGVSPLPTVESPPTEPSRPSLMAHRGLVKLAPENTLPAFALALELRMDLELDVYQTKDNQLVVIHDKTVDRTTNGEGTVTEMTLEELKQLDAGSWFDPAFTGEKIPTLAEVFELVKQRQVRPTTIAINMKTISPGIETRIVNLVEKYGLLEQVFCFGMGIDSNERFKQANSRIPTAIMTSGFSRLNLTNKAHWTLGVAEPTTQVLWVNFLPTHEQIEEAHRAGKTVVLYILDDRAMMEQAVQLPLDIICSDYVLDMREMMKSLPRKESPPNRDNPQESTSQQP